MIDSCFINTRTRTDALSQKETSQLIVLLTAYPIKYCFRLAPLHRGSFGMLPKKAGLQTFLHSQAPSREFSMAWFSENKAECIRTLLSVNAIKRSLMAFMLRSHNGVHCCGTVGDSHSHSQLSTAKCTFTGDSFKNHDAKVRISEQNTKFYLRIFERKYLRRSQRYKLVSKMPIF